jgi:hypothetical protein
MMESAAYLTWAGHAPATSLCLPQLLPEGLAYSYHKLTEPCTKIPRIDGSWQKLRIGSYDDDVGGGKDDKPGYRTHPGLKSGWAERLN